MDAEQRGESAVLVQWLLTELHGRLRLFASDRSQLRRQIAAAALMRCTRSLEVIGNLLRDGYPDITGIVVRHAWECWLVGTYVALGGDAAEAHLTGDHARSVEVLRRRWPRSGSEPGEFDASPGKKLSMEAVAHRVKELLERQDPPSPLVDAHMFYDVVYRSESTAGAHANLGLLMRYFDWDGDTVSLVPDPDSAVASDRAEEMVAIYLAHLAGFVFDLFEVPRDRVDAIFQALVALPPPGVEPPTESDT